MTVLEVALGVGLATTIIWSCVLYLLQLSRIEKLEADLEECDNEVEREIWGK
jgi:hypothetical protein